MIELSNLRKYRSQENRARLEADIKFTDINVEAPAETMWIEIDANYSDNLVDDTYDPFFLVSLFLAMNYETDLRIHGNVSKKLYKNLTWYGQKILCDFSSKLKPVKIIVDGFAPTQARGTLIGGGVSGGVDSSSTLYDRFIKENDPDYKINALFFFNCGSNGNIESSFTSYFAQSRNRRGIAIASELHLPLYPVDSNLHQFHRPEYGDNFFYLSVYSCVLALQNSIKRYYVASAYAYYNEIKANGPKYSHYDLASFCESYFIPLIQTERTELIIDGCQNRRVDKIKNIADWDIAKKYLNVCRSYSKDFSNCGVCEKCFRTLLALEIMNKLDDFAEIFDLEEYRKKSFEYKCKVVASVDRHVFHKELFDLAEEYNFPMPTRRDCYVLGRQVTIFE